MKRLLSYLLLNEFQFVFFFTWNYAFLEVCKSGSIKSYQTYCIWIFSAVCLSDRSKPFKQEPYSSAEPDQETGVQGLRIEGSEMGNGEQSYTHEDSNL